MPAPTLYDPTSELDACGIGFVAHLSGEPSHDILAQALTAVGRMAHRAASAPTRRAATAPAF